MVFVITDVITRVDLNERIANREAYLAGPSEGYARGKGDMEGKSLAERLDVVRVHPSPSGAVDRRGAGKKISIHRKITSTRAKPHR